MRSYAGEADLPRIVDFVNMCDAAEQLDYGTSIAELRDELSDPTFDPARDIGLWEDADGMLVGYGQLSIPPSGDDLAGFLWFRAHPSVRGSGLEAEIFTWAAERVRDLARQRGLKARLRTGSVATAAERIALIEQHGFMPVRYFVHMSRSLAEPLPDPQFPAGFTLRHVTGPEDVPAWVELFNLSFIDHWDHHDLTVEQRLHWLSESHYRPQDDLIAVAPDGTFAAFCKCLVLPEQNQRTGRSEGWISLLGSRRGYRNMGLGRAMLLAGMRHLKADGLATAVLGVDTVNPTGAVGLYESVGFQPYRTLIAFAKKL
jgi:mycothiol synthase